MQDWLDNHVGQKEDPDYAPLRDQVEAGLRRQLKDEPGLVEEGKGWADIRRMANNNNFMPEIEPTDDEQLEGFPDSGEDMKDVHPDVAGTPKVGDTHAFDQDGYRVDPITGEELAHPDVHSIRRGQGPVDPNLWESKQSPELQGKGGNLPLKGSPRAGMPFDTPITEEEYKLLANGVPTKDDMSPEEQQTILDKHHKTYNPDAAINKITTPTKTEEVPPEPPSETPPTEPEPESTEGEAVPPADKAGEADEEPVVEPPPARERRPRAGQQPLDLPKPGAAERRAAQPWYDREGAGEDEKVDPIPDVDPSQSRLPGFGDDELPPSGDEEDGVPPDPDKPPPKGRTPKEGQQKLGLRRRRGEAAQPQAVTPEESARLAGEDDAAPEREPEGKQLGFEDETQLGFPGMPRAERATPTETTEEGEPQPEGVPEGQQSFEDYRQSAQAVEDRGRDVQAREAAKRQPSSIDKMRQQLKDKFNQEHEHVDALSDEEVEKDHKQYQQDLNRQRARNQITTGHSKEDVFKAMAKAANRDGDEGYLQTLRDKYQFDDVKEVTRLHKATEKTKAENKFKSDSINAIADATIMDKLPEEGTDKLHAKDRLRDIAKKMGDSQRAIDTGGKGLLDLNATNHLKSLLDDAVDKGNLSDAEIEEIANEQHTMGEDFLNEAHRTKIEESNNKTRAKNDEFVAYAEGDAQRGHDFDHSKAHERHHYEENEDGTVGKRTGSSYHNTDGRDRHESLNEAAAGEDGKPVETQHPPKLLGLNRDQKLEQDEHFKLVKKLAAGTEPLSDDEMDRFKELEANNPDLADHNYKSQLLGAQRHLMNGMEGENGANGTDVKNAMGINEEDHGAADEASCRPEAGSIHGGVGKAWNPSTHRWCDEEYLKEQQGKILPGEGLHFPDGLHHGTENSHLDKDKDGNVQAVMLTQTGVHKVNPLDEKTNMTTPGAVVAHHLGYGDGAEKHSGGNVNKKTINAMGLSDSTIHTPKVQGIRPLQPFPQLPLPGLPVTRTPKEGKDKASYFKEQQARWKADPLTRGVKAGAGYIKRLAQRSRERNEEKPNASASDRLRNSRGTDSSALTNFLKRMGTEAGKGIKEGVSSIGDTSGVAGYVAGGAVRRTNLYQDQKIRDASKRVADREAATKKLNDRIHRVLGENE